MKRSLSLCTLFILFISLPGMAATGYEKDENLVTHIKNTTAIPDAELQSSLRARANWQNFLKDNGPWWVEFSEQNFLPRRAMGEPVAIPGSDPVSKALLFFQDHLKDYKVPVQSLYLTGNNSSRKYDYVDFQQRYSGLEILFSRATVRFNKDGAAVLFGLEIYPDVQLNILPTLTAGDAEGHAMNSISGTATGAAVLPSLKILPVQEGESGYAYKLVYEVEVEAIRHNGMPARYYTLVDAHSGDILYRQNKVHNCQPPAGDITVDADITDNPGQPAVNRGLPHLRVKVNNVDHYTDANGVLNLPTLTSSTQATVYLEGKYAKIYTGNSGTSVISFTQTVNPGPNLISFNNNSNSRERSAYYHVNVVHDHLKDYAPATFTTLDFPFITRVDRTDGDCNAFYNGSSINFYAAGGGCPATALFSDVVYHEYGHGINYDLYDHLGGNFMNGALGEGYADVWGLSISKNPIIAPGFSGGNSYIRRYDIDPKRYPEDLVGQVHADGEIIAGAWWDTYLNIGSHMDSMMYLFMESHYGLAMAPSGLEGQLYRDIYIDVLLADDTDGNIVNGTPRFNAISSAFSKHGISLLTNATLTHTEAIVAPQNAPLPISAELVIDFPFYLNGVNLYYRTANSGPFTSVPMTAGPGNNYEVNIPALPQGTVVEYYMEVEDIFLEKAVVQPVKANVMADPNLRYFTIIGMQAVIKEDLDNQIGNWLVDPDGTDDAISGEWEAGSPVASYDTEQNIVQTGTDHTEEGADLNFCVYTGNAAPNAGMGTNDVDQGQTTIQSPIFDLSSFTDPIISYYRWFINNPAGGANPGNDSWKVYITNDGQTWHDVERTYVSDRRWRRNVIKVSDFVTPNETVYFRFVASDSIIPSANLDGGSIVEAAVDDIYVYDVEGGIGIDVPQERVINIYPNPAYDNFTVQLDKRMKGITRVEVINITGEILYQQERSYAPALHIPLDNIPSGSYFVRITSEGNLYYKPLQVVRN